MKFLETIFEIIGAIQIILSPLFIGFIVGCILYSTDKTGFGTIYFIISICIGFLLGLIWAIKVWKKYGTIRFISRINETPDIKKSEVHK